MNIDRDHLRKRRRDKDERVMAHSGRMQTMEKEHSKFNVVTRFAYIFATIVTIFAQMGAAPLALVNAVTAGTSSNGTSSNITLTLPPDIADIRKKAEAAKTDPKLGSPDFKAILTVNGSQDYSSGTKFTINWSGKGITSLQTQSSAMGNTFKDNATATWTKNSATFTLTKDMEAPWSFDILFSVTSDSLGGEFGGTDNGGHEIDKVDLPTAKTNDLKLTLADGQANSVTAGDTVNYQLDTDLTIYPEDEYRDVEVGLDQAPTGDYLAFDQLGTDALLKKHGFQSSGASPGDGYTAYKYSKDNITVSLLVYDDGTIRFSWPKGTTGKPQAFIAMKAKTAIDNVTLTPSYLGSTTAGDQPRTLGTGTGASVQIIKKAEQPVTIKIHKGSLVDPSDSLAGAKFKVWGSDQAESAAKETPATDSDGNTTVTLDNASADQQYNIKETVAPTKSVKQSDNQSATTTVKYALDTQTHKFTVQSATNSVTAVASGEQAISTAKADDTAHAGMLMFNDMPLGSGPVGDPSKGGNGSNGGTLTLKKGDASSTTTPPDGATFAIYEKINGTQTKLADQTTTNGGFTLDLGKPTTSNRTLIIQETKAPAGYQLDGKQYQMLISPTGKVALGDATADLTDFTKTASTNGMVVLAGNVIKFSDLPASAKAPQPLVVQKVAKADNKPLLGAHFGVMVKPVINVFTGVTLDPGSENLDVPTDDSGKLSIDLGLATGTGRIVSLQEATAPNGYLLNGNQYDVKLNADGSVVGVAKWVSGKEDVFGQQTDDGVLSVKDGKLVFVDDVDPDASRAISIKKVDEAGKGLPGAKFKAWMGDADPANVAESDATDASGALSIKMSRPSAALSTTVPGVTTNNNVVTLMETQAPAGYKLDGSKYQIKLDDKGTVEGVAKVGDTPPDSYKAVDGALSLQNDGTLQFEDEQDPDSQPSVINIRKTAADSGTGLAGATFAVSRLFSPVNKNIVEDLATADKPVTDANGDVQLTETKVSEGTYSIKEMTAPNGYEADPTTYYFYWTKAQGVTGLGTDSEMTKGTTVGNLKIDKVNGTNGLIFADEKVKAPTTADFKIKKFAEDGSTTLAGAKFTITDVTNNKSYPESDATGSDGMVTIKVDTDAGHATRVFKVQESTAPAGYTKANDYYVQWNANDGVTGVSKSQTSFTPMLGSDAFAIGGGLGITDKKAPAYVTINKVAADTNLPLAGAKFSLQEYDKSTNKPIGSAYTSTEGTDATGKGVIDVGASNASAADRYFKITETAAPAGYATVSDKDPLYIAWSPKTQAVDSVGGSLASLKDSYENLKTDSSTGAVTFADPKTTGFSIKKVSKSDPTQALSGAVLRVREVDSYGNVIGTDFAESNFTTDKTGVKTVPVAQMNVGSTKTYMIRETTAPVGYKASDNLFFVHYVVGVGIKDIGVATSMKPGDVKTWGQTAGDMTIKDGQLVLQDETTANTIKVFSRYGNSGDSQANKTAPVAGAKVTLAPVGGTAGRKLEKTTQTDGTISVTPEEMANMLGMPASGSTQVAVRLTVDTTEQGFTDPLPRVVVYTFGSNNPGFALKPTDGDSPQGDDGMVSDHNDTRDSIGAGNLGVTVRMDTLHAESQAADATGNKQMMVGAVFNFAYSYQGKVLGDANVTIDDNGTNLLQNPDQLLGSDTIPIGKDVEVTVTMVSASTGYSKVAPQTMVYNSSLGYQRLGGGNLDAGSMVTAIDPETGLPYVFDPKSNVAVPVSSFEWKNPDQTTTVDLFAFGGSQISYYLPAQNLAVTVPQVLNFGQHDVSSMVNRVGLLPQVANATSEYAQYGGTQPMTTADADLNNIAATVTQTGTFEGGWSLSLVVQPLAAEVGTDKISDATLYLKDDQYVTTNGQDSLPILHADGTKPDTYKATWPIKGVGLSLPAGSGQSETNYRSQMDWNIDVAP